MIFDRTKVTIVLSYFIPDICMIGYLLNDYYMNNSRFLNFKTLFVIIASFYLIKTIIFITYYLMYYHKRVRSIQKLTAEYQKGRFRPPFSKIQSNDYLADLFNEMLILGKHLDEIVSTQREELTKFHEIYNNIVFSIDSLFLVFDSTLEIIFVNDAFCKRFQLDQQDVVGKNIDDLFNFSNTSIIDSMNAIKEMEDTIILEKTPLSSRKKITAIADIKISRMNFQGKSNIIMVLDDITKKCRNDYRISLISQLTETIQHDAEIEKIFYAILTGATSGSGLGFNRAMLLIYDEDNNILKGTMAVGPDTMEEAITIWHSVPDGKFDVVTKLKNTDVSEISKNAFYEKVVKTNFSTEEDNLFISALKDMQSIHIHDAWNDSRVNADLRAFMDVNEFLIMPLVAFNKCIGLIIVDNKFNRMPIYNDSIELLTIFATQAALTLENYHNFISIQKDMTKIRERQDAIVEAEKLAAVGRIAAHIAHEIRNPLVTVGGYARRILKLTSKTTQRTVAKDPVRDQETLNKSAEIILSEIERLEKILSNVMDFTRPTPFILEFNNVNEIIIDTYELLKNMLQERHIAINLDLQEDIPLIKSDFNQLKQVILNLIQNAVDASTENGTIFISTKTDSEKAIITIRDTGTGIREEDLGNLFEPFFTTKVTGVGLGLAIVKKIITDHNGEISADNWDSGGAEFKITLPLPT